MSAQPVEERPTLSTDHVLAEPAPVTPNSWRPFPVYYDDQAWTPHVPLRKRAMAWLRSRTVTP